MPTMTRILSSLLGLALIIGLFLPAAESAPAPEREGFLAGPEGPSVRPELTLSDGIAGPVTAPMIFFCGALAFFLSAFGLQRLCLAPSLVSAGLVLLSRGIAFGLAGDLDILPEFLFPASGGSTGMPVETAWVWLAAASCGSAVLALADILGRRRSA